MSLIQREKKTQQQYQQQQHDSDHYNAQNRRRDNRSSSSRREGVVGGVVRNDDFKIRQGAEIIRKEIASGSFDYSTISHHQRRNIDNTWTHDRKRGDTEDTDSSPNSVTSMLESINFSGHSLKIYEDLNDTGIQSESSIEKIPIHHRTRDNSLRNKMPSQQQNPYQPKQKDHLSKLNRIKQTLLQQEGTIYGSRSSIERMPPNEKWKTTGIDNRDVDDHNKSSSSDSVEISAVVDLDDGDNEESMYEEGLEVTSQDFAFLSSRTPTSPNGSETIRRKPSLVTPHGLFKGRSGSIKPRSFSQSSSAIQPLSSDNGEYRTTQNSASNSNYRSNNTKSINLKRNSITKGWDNDQSSLDDDIVELQNVFHDSPNQNGWDPFGDNGNGVEINNIQSNVYLLKPSDYNDDSKSSAQSRHTQASRLGTNSLRLPAFDDENNDNFDTMSDIHTIVSKVEKPFNRKMSEEIDHHDDVHTISEEKHDNIGRKTSGLSLIRNSRSLLEQEYDDCNDEEEDYNLLNMKNYGDPNKNQKVAQPGKFQRATSDIELANVPSPLSYEYDFLLQDPAYTHAMHAGLLWQSIVGQHVRFPSSWWNGARSPPMGICKPISGNSTDVKYGTTITWTYYGRYVVSKNLVLNQLVPSRAAPGRLLFHIIVLDGTTCQPIQDIAIGCFHPNARGIRKAARPNRAVENTRELWIGTRNRKEPASSHPGNRNSTVSLIGIDKLIRKHATWGVDGYTKSPLGPDMRVNNTNVRSVLGEEPPLETMILSENELYDRVSKVMANSGNNNKRSSPFKTLGFDQGPLSLPLAILNEFVFP